ncbi:AP-5 complex subunit beta-1 [Silurus asotus]|uniref:AP-5 complex subunit beta-1 n=1 Tax=Silurus asotus TaxID=30991 RepID=A0AAD5AUX6_SILAS|nr:AP-5 complex subunit beta-1 [Silurus asotus]
MAEYRESSHNHSTAGRGSTGEAWKLDFMRARPGRAVSESSLYCDNEADNQDSRAGCTHTSVLQSTRQRNFSIIMTSWDARISSLLFSPTQFLSRTTSEMFLADLLDNLRDDKTNDSKKILLLSVFLEHPTILCTTTSAGEQTAHELVSILNCTPQKSVGLKCHLLLAITSVLICTSCLADRTKVAEDYLSFLFSLIQDTNDNVGGPTHHAVRAGACECLREMETCQPGLLSQKLEALYYLKQQETTVLHQSYCMLYTEVLKNAIRFLTQEKDVDNAKLRSVLAGNEGFLWKFPQFTKSNLSVSMAQAPQLPTTLDFKELKSIMSLILEESYLMTSPSQAALLRGLVEVVAMVPGISPAIFKSQLLRLFGTTEVELMHATLFMKGTFTDSLFTAEDEHFLLKRLVGMAQHPLLRVPEKLFYIDCILHFPENRPISSSGEECLPVLITPKLTLSLFPSVFNDSTTMLSRLNLLCLVHLEANEEEDGQGLGYLLNHVMALLRIVDKNGSRETVVTSFRAIYLFLVHFNHMENLLEKLVHRLRKLFSGNCHLAPNLINLTDRIQERLEDSLWSVRLLKALQRCIVEMPSLQLTLQSLGWHLKILARVAQESQITQKSSICFLRDILVNSNLCERRSWHVGTAILAVCRNLLQHPTLNQMFIELADLLQHMSRHYEDTDIQDHARFYYTLLTNLSSEKLASVLANAPIGGQAKIRSLSTITANEELGSCSIVLQTESCIIQLEKIPPNGSQDLVQTAEVPTQKDLYEFYQEQLKTPGFASEVTLRYNLTHVNLTDPRFDRIFTICLHFNADMSHYAKVEDIYVPCLFRDRKPQRVSVNLKPYHPYPTRLRVSAIFTTEDGQSWHTHLPDVRVSFPEIFLSVPLPLDTPPQLKEDMFDRIWDALASGKPSASETSLFCFKAEGTTLADLIKNFQRYVISQGPNGWKVLFFLPPTFHILLNIREGEDSVQVSVATDNWELLPHVNSYLQNLTVLCNTATNNRSGIEELRGPDIPC